MITKEIFMRACTELGDQARDDIAWSESLTGPVHSVDFAQEIIFVICNSGMKNTVAREIYNRVSTSLLAGRSASLAFRHKGKVAAIDAIWKDRDLLLSAYHAAPDKLAFLESLPWIGPITKYHAAKNFGMNVAKPDVHLQRLADLEACTPQELCDRLAAETGLRAATVDVVLWRACANGVINSRTGELKP